jgi:hypothetical protein
MDIYLGPLVYITYDLGTNFNTQEFYNNTRIINIELLQKLVETYYLIGRIERYYIPFKHMYNIIRDKDPILSKEIKLQIVFKTINNIIGPDSLVPIILVFGAYP